MGDYHRETRPELPSLKRLLGPDLHNSLGYIGINAFAVGGFMHRLLLVLVGLTSLGPTVTAQDGPPSAVWGQRFAAVIHAIFPSAQLQPPRLPPGLRDDLQYWNYEGSEIYLSFTELASHTEAEQLLEQLTIVLPVPSRPVSGFGDRAFFIIPQGPGQRRMNVRRHNIVIEIGAPEEIALSRLALALVNVIDKSQARARPQP